MRKPKRPRDTNQLAKAIVDLATGEKMETAVEDPRNPHAVAIGRLGGLKGGEGTGGEALKGKASEDCQEGGGGEVEEKIKSSTSL